MNRALQHRKERGHGVPCPYEDLEKALRLFGLGGGGMSARPDRPRGLRG
jgi:hypothetical protein